MTPSNNTEHVTTLVMLGTEFKRFYSDPAIWGKTTFHDDTLIEVDGVNASDAEIDLSTVSDTAILEVSCGVIIDRPPGVPEDMLEAITWWRARQASTQYLVTVPNHQIAAFEAALADLGIQYASPKAG